MSANICLMSELFNKKGEILPSLLSHNIKIRQIPTRRIESLKKIPLKIRARSYGKSGVSLQFHAGSNPTCDPASSSSSSYVGERGGEEGN